MQHPPSDALEADLPPTVWTTGSRTRRSRPLNRSLKQPRPHSIGLGGKGVGGGGKHGCMRHSPNVRSDVLPSLHGRADQNRRRTEATYTPQVFSSEEWLKQAGKALRSRTLPDGNPPATVSGQGELQVRDDETPPPAVRSPSGA